MLGQNALWPFMSLICRQHRPIIMMLNTWNGRIVFCKFNCTVIYLRLFLIIFNDIQFSWKLNHGTIYSTLLPWSVFVPFSGLGGHYSMFYHFLLFSGCLYHCSWSFKVLTLNPLLMVICFWIIHLPPLGCRMPQ
jgi:hypothetical protein